MYWTEWFVEPKFSSSTKFIFHFCILLYFYGNIWSRQIFLFCFFHHLFFYENLILDIEIIFKRKNVVNFKWITQILKLKKFKLCLPLHDIELPSQNFQVNSECFQGYHKPCLLLHDHLTHGQESSLLWKKRRKKYNRIVKKAI